MGDHFGLSLAHRLDGDRLVNRLDQDVRFLQWTERRLWMLRVTPRYTGLVMLHAQYLELCDRILAEVVSTEEKLAVIHEMQRLLGCTDAELGDRKRSLKEHENQGVDFDEKVAAG